MLTPTLQSLTEIGCPHGQAYQQRYQELATTYGVCHLLMLLDSMHPHGGHCRPKLHNVV